MTVTPLQGDRSAWDVDGYPSKHASDLYAGMPAYHTPLPGTVGEILVSDGTKWTSQAPGNTGFLAPIMTLGTYEGGLIVAETPFKIYNQYGMDRNITKVFLSVGTAPTGDDIIIDIKLDEVSIFDSDLNRPTILAGEVTGYSVTIEIPTWLQDSYITWEILQIGSGTPGSNLVIHIIHDGNIIGGSGS